MRIKRIVLEDHGDVPVLWRYVIDELFADVNAAGGDVL